MRSFDQNSRRRASSAPFADCAQVPGFKGFPGFCGCKSEEEASRG